jgi:hypothetical protein
MGHPPFVVAPADSRFLIGLVAQFGMTKSRWGLRCGEVVPFPGLIACLAGGEYIPGWICADGGEVLL